MVGKKADGPRHSWSVRNGFLSPARRGRGILVAPGFLWAQKLKKLLVVFFKFTMTFQATWGCERDFYKILPKLKMATRVKKNCGPKDSKTQVQKLFNFTITFPTIWTCAGDFFKVLLKFKMATTDQPQFFYDFFSNFNIKYLATCGCASDFLKDANKIQNGCHKSTPKFLWAQKKSKIIQILLSHPPSYDVTFSKFHWNSKWPPRINFNILVGAKTQKIV